jgi:hypothetical protein
MVQRDACVEKSTPTAEQIEVRVAKAKARWQTPLDESTIPQFPRETSRLHISTSDLAHQHQWDQDVASTAPASPQSHKRLPSKPLQMPMSPSVYSRNTDGVSLQLNDSVMSLEDTHEHATTTQEGSALILTSQSVRSYVIGSPSPNRPSSTQSSRDWKAWLSHEVSSFETAGQEDLKFYDKPEALPRQVKDCAFQPIRREPIGSEDTTVIVRGSLDKSTPRAHPRNPSTPPLEQQLNRISKSRDQAEKIISSIVEDTKEDQLTPKTSSPSQTRPSHQISSGQKRSILVNSASHSREDRSTSTLSSTTSLPQPLPGMPNSARMNDRFPFLDTGKRSSSSRNSSGSYQSKSPRDSWGLPLKSAKSTPGLESSYRNSSGSTTDKARSSTLHPAHASQNSKENITPPSSSKHQRSNASPLRPMTRPKSAQPLSPTDPDRRVANTADHTTKSNETSSAKRVSYPAETVVARPNIRVTVRPLSSEKFARRPRSAFDLRNTPPPRPASELRRSAAPVMISSPLSDQHVGSDVGAETSVRTKNTLGQRSGSVTPGHKMAERFLKERKSVAVLERGVRRGTGKIVREDTPAFL